MWWDNSSNSFDDFTTDGGRDDPGGECTLAGPESGWAGGYWSKKNCVLTTDKRDTVCELTCNDTTAGEWVVGS